jgi:urease subunit gamma/beta
MRLTPWEEERLLLFAAAELARRHRGAGILLNAPEAVALISDAMLEAARAGRSYAEVEAAGRDAVSVSEVITGVRELVDLVNVEVLLEDGTRLVSLVDPIGGGESAHELGPGAVVAPPEPTSGSLPGAAGREDGRERLELTVTNTSRRIVRVSSHFPFDQVNARLQFDRAAARGFHLDLDAGSSQRWSPGETVTVTLVRFGGGADRPAWGTEA